MSTRPLTRDEVNAIILALEDRADKLHATARPQSADKVLALVVLLSEADAVTVTNDTPREPIVV